MEETRALLAAEPPMAVEQTVCCVVLAAEPPLAVEQTVCCALLAAEQTVCHHEGDAGSAGGRAGCVRGAYLEGVPGQEYG